ELMNYVLYETDQRFVPLEKEVAYIRSYIELEEIRYENRFNCNLAIAGNVQSTQVPPMLLLPFVENAFKHGINEESNNAWINIALDVTDGTLHFQLENSLPELSAGRKKNGKGIGIKNVKKRLALLYPGNHKLKCSKEEHYYRVELNINLDSNNEPS
ncbi:MAG: histidine kinase, partial [Chloroflexota bacterium]|nr:histidine kinase [Chloroflexota bacterium]